MSFSVQLSVDLWTNELMWNTVYNLGHQNIYVDSALLNIFPHGDEIIKFSYRQNSHEAVLKVIKYVLLSYTSLMFSLVYFTYLE